MAVISHQKLTEWHYLLPAYLHCHRQRRYLFFLSNPYTVRQRDTYLQWYVQTTTWTQSIPQNLWLLSSQDHGCFPETSVATWHCLSVQTEPSIMALPAQDCVSPTCGGASFLDLQAWPAKIMPTFLINILSKTYNVHLLIDILQQKHTSYVTQKHLQNWLQRSPNFSDISAHRAAAAADMMFGVKP